MLGFHIMYIHVHYIYRERERGRDDKYIQTKIKAFQPAFVQFVRLVFLECQQEINKRLPPVDSFKKKRPAKQPSGTGVLSLEPVNQLGFGRVGIVASKYLVSTGCPDCDVYQTVSIFIYDMKWLSWDSRMLYDVNWCAADFVTNTMRNWFQFCTIRLYPVCTVYDAKI